MSAVTLSLIDPAVIPWMGNVTVTVLIQAKTVTVNTMDESSDKFAEPS